MYGLKVDSVEFLIINPAHHERKRKEKKRKKWKKKRVPRKRKVGPGLGSQRGRHLSKELAKKEILTNSFQYPVDRSHIYAAPCSCTCWCLFALLGFDLEHFTASVLGAS